MTLDQAESSGFVRSAALNYATLHVDKKDRKGQSREEAQLPHLPTSKGGKARSASSQSLLLTSVRTVMVSEWVESVLAKPVRTARGWEPTLTHTSISLR